jgi:hypothetical protein
MQSIELPAIASMVPYKRNQVEEAISAVMEPWLREPSTELRSRIKRLLDSDRAFYLEPDSRNPEHTKFAFYGRNNEQVHGGDVRCVVTQEGGPSLGRRAASLDHVLRDAGLSDLEAELEQLAMDTEARKI